MGRTEHEPRCRRGRDRHGGVDLKANIWTNKGEIPGNGEDDDKNGFKDDVHGWDFRNNDNDPTAALVPVDILPPFCIEHPTKKRMEAHGSHVAGTIGAVGQNKTGIAGITWKVKIMPLKFLGGTCGSGSTSDAIAAINYAVANGAHIINASWGGGSFSQALKLAIKDAHDAGVLFVAAAGNTATDNDVTPRYPASYDLPNILVVAASDMSDELAGFSCFGKSSVDLAAPGVQILSTIPVGDENSGPTSTYAKFNGTSMATPVVVGTAALIKAKYPSIGHLQIKQLILQTVDTNIALLDKVATSGRLNAARALSDSLPLPPAVAQALKNAPPKYQKAILKQLTPLKRMQLFLNPPFDASQSSKQGPKKKLGSRKKKLGIDFRRRKSLTSLKPSNILETSEIVAQATERKIEFIIGFKKTVGKQEISQIIRPMKLISLKVASQKRNIYGVVVRTGLARSRAFQQLKNHRQVYLLEFDSTVKPN